MINTKIKEFKEEAKKQCEEKKKEIDRDEYIEDQKRKFWLNSNNTLLPMREHHDSCR